MRGRYADALEPVTASDVWMKRLLMTKIASQPAPAAIDYALE